MHRVKNMKKEKILKNKKLNNVLVLGLVFLLSFCTIGAVFTNSTAPKTANAYSQNDEFVAVYDVYNIVGAAGGIFTPVYVFDGFDTQPLGTYADGVPSNREKITNFNKSLDGFQINQGLSHRLKLNEITSDKHYYSGTVQFTLKHVTLLAQEEVYAVGVFPESGQGGITPQLFFLKLDKYGAEVTQSFVFPEYKTELENAYGSIIVYKMTSTNKYGNPFPVFENSPGYDTSGSLTGQQYDFIFYPEQVNRTATGVLSQKSRPHYINHTETSAKIIELTLPAWGYWTWFEETLNFDNVVDGEELYTKPLNYTLSKGFSSGGVSFNGFTVNETAGTINYDSYTVYSAGAFIDQSARQLYFADTVSNKFFFDENISYFLTQNIAFYIKKGEDALQPGTPAGLTLSVTGVVLGAITGIIGAITGTLPLIIIGGGVAIAGGIGGTVTTILDPNWQKALELLPGQLWDAIQAGGEVIISPILPILPTPDKTPFWNIVITVTWILVIVAIVMVVIRKKNKK